MSGPFSKTYMHFEEVKVELTHLHYSQCWTHEFQNPYDGDDNDGGDESFHYMFSSSLMEVLEGEVSNVQDWERSKHNCKAWMCSSDFLV